MAVRSIFFLKKWAKPRLVFVYFCSFHFCSVAFSRIRTWIIEVEGKYVGHMTTTTARGIEATNLPTVPHSLPLIGHKISRNEITTLNNVFRFGEIDAFCYSLCNEDSV